MKFWDAVRRVLYLSEEQEAELAGRLRRREWEKRAQSLTTQESDESTGVER